MNQPTENHKRKATPAASVRTVAEARMAALKTRYELLTTALAYAEGGYAVLPLTGKALPAGMTTRNATVKAAKIREWFDDLNITGVGLATGNRFFVMDFTPSDFDPDVGDIVHPTESSLPAGARKVATPSGGSHYYFAIPEGGRIDSNNRLLEDVNIRGVGGYVAAPPTESYQLEVDAPIDAVEAPAWLLAKIKKAAADDVREKIPQLLSLNIPPAEYLVADLIPRGSLGMLVGAPGCGKSTVLQSMMMALSRGTSWMGRETIKTPVFYFDKENPDVVAQATLKRLGCTDDSNIFYCGRWVDGGVPDLDQIQERVPIVSLRPLCVFDSFTRFHEGDENSASDVRKTMEYLRGLTALGATVIYIHHTGKSNTGRSNTTARGSNDITAAPDWSYSVTSTQDQEGFLETVTLARTRFRYKSSAGFVLDAYPEGDFTPAAEKSTVGSKPKSFQKTDSLTGLELLARAGGAEGVSKAKFKQMAHDQHGVSKGAVDRWLKDRCDASRIVLKQVGQTIYVIWNVEVAASK